MARCCQLASGKRAAFSAVTLDSDALLSYSLEQEKFTPELCATLLMMLLLLLFFHLRSKLNSKIVFQSYSPSSLTKPVFYFFEEYFFFLMTLLSSCFYKVALGQWTLKGKKLSLCIIKKESCSIFWRAFPFEFPDFNGISNAFEICDFPD